MGSCTTSCNRAGLLDPGSVATWLEDVGKSLWVSGLCLIICITGVDQVSPGTASVRRSRVLRVAQTRLDSRAEISPFSECALLFSVLSLVPHMAPGVRFSLKLLHFPTPKTHPQSPSSHTPNTPTVVITITSGVAS